MHFDHNLIGKSSPPQTFEVTLEAVKHFMEATADPALQSKEPLQYAPPTFPTTFRIHVPDLQLDPTTMQLLHGEQQYNYMRQVLIGEKITCIAHIADVRERHGKGGTMAFIITETTGIDSQQQPVYTARSTLIVRQK